MIRLNRLASSALILAAVAGLAACNQTYGGGPAYPANQGVYQQGGYQQTTQFGTVTAVDYVPAGTGQSSGMVGAAAGGVVGGVLGNQIGGGSGRTAATVAGVADGALIGHTLERNMTGGQQTVAHYRVSVRFDDGSVRSFNYAQAPNIRIGERVRAEGNQLYR